jgi:hypothetical protein
MLSTAIAVLNATKDAIFDEEIMGLAGELHTRRNELTDEMFPRFIYMYSTALASKVADLTTKALLSEQEMSDLIATIDEMDNLSETILEENK